MNDNYCIRPDYTARHAAETFVADWRDYWTDFRLEAVVNYQHHVYAAAGALIRRHRLETALDVGCGYPTKLDLLAPVRPILIDQPAMMPLISRDMPELILVPDDLERPSALDDARFDLVICADVLEHLLDPDPCMAFIRERAGRFAVLSTPERDALRGPDALTSEKPEHVREWNFDEFFSFVESRGFEILAHEVTSQGRMGLLERIRHRLPRRPARLASCQYVVARPRR